MSARERALVIALPVLALVTAFWFLLLSPKRDEAAKLGEQVAKLRSSVTEVEREVAAASQAKSGYRDYYASLIGLGKAVPRDADTPALFVQLSRLAKRSHVNFETIDLKEGSGTTTAAPAPGAANGKDSGKKADEKDASVAATEAAAAALPLGASIGSAGFPVMPYDLKFRGSFFRMADFIHGLNRMVSTRDGRLAVRGRLLTIDGFSLSTLDRGRFPTLDASFTVTAYVTPAGEGLTAGGTSTAPAPAGSAQPVSTAGGKP